MAQAPDRPGREHLARALPGPKLGKIEIDHGRPAARARGVEHRARTGKVGGERLFHEHRLAPGKCPHRDVRLPIGRDRDGHRIDVFDQRRPVAISARDIRRARKLARARRVGARERDHLASRVGAERRDKDGPAVIAADDADTDHSELSRTGAAALRRIFGLAFVGIRSIPLRRPQIPHREREQETLRADPVTHTKGRKCARLAPQTASKRSFRKGGPTMSVKVCRLAVAGLGCVMASSASAELLAHKSLTAKIAIAIAETTLATCTANGYRVSVTVVGRNGEVLLQVRGDNTNPHTMENSYKKAYTARTFSIPSGEMEERLKKNPQMGAQYLTGFTTARGALPIKLGNEVIGAAGASGAPGGEKDEACIKAGLDKVAADLK